jgi:hypothetical protein
MPNIVHEALNIEPPCFVSMGPDYYDGWNPPSDARSPAHPDLEELVGEFYADIAVAHARKIGQYAFITMVMAAIFYKTTHGHIRMGALEQGFLGRIGRLAYVGSLN